MSLPNRLAVLIDAENTNAANVGQLMAAVATFGNPVIRRAYGDWTTTQLTPWKDVMFTMAIRPEQQFHYAKGKNTSDSALIMDAMELIHVRRADGICIVASDSDYIGLAGRIREAGLRVYGFGTKQTPRAFRSACDAFVVLGDPE